MVTIHHNNMNNTPSTNTRWAFTMAESVISLVVVAGMMVAALNMVGSAAKARQSQMTQGQGLALANHLMTEILCAHYEDPSSDDSEPSGSSYTRIDFDDLDDYNGYVESPPCTKNGIPLDGYDGWVRQVTVTYANVTQADNDSYTDLGLKRITVTVTSDKNVATTIVALRAADGAYEHTVDDGTTLVGSMGVTLQIGQTRSAVVSGINLLNEAAGEALAEEPPENNPPIAVAMCSPQSGMKPLTVMFYATGSYDPDPDDTLTYFWDFADGTDGAGETASHTYWQQGKYDVILTVTDNQGATDTAIVTVTVSGTM